MGRSYLSYTMALILQVAESGYRYGFDIMAVTGLPSGTVYPALRRLEDSGFVVSRWEESSIAHRQHRPVRKYYEVSDAGRTMLADACKRFRLLSQFEPLTVDKSAKENL